jgi:hypothetical protein
MNHGVELLGKPSLEVVAPAFRFRTINDPYRTLEPLLTEQPGRVVFTAQIEMEIGNAHSMEEFFVTAAQTRTDAAALGRIAPILRGRHRAGISTEANRKDIASSGI